jgi:uncharacterized OsmC-like protein
MAGSQSIKPVTVTHLGGMRFCAEVRGHRIVVDQPVTVGGTDSAPSPIELLTSSLGCCVAFYVQQFCHSRALPYLGMSVEVTPQTTAGRIDRFMVRVNLPEALPPRETELLQRVARSCPAHATLSHGADITVAIDVPVTA